MNYYINRSLSIIIPCRNEEKYIGNCLESFIDMDFENNLMEILVVDGNSTDGSLSIIREYQNKYPFIQLINNPQKYTPHGLNIGIKNARNEFIMIASAHSSFSKGYIYEVFKVLIELKADAAGGMMITDVKNKTQKTLSICKVFSNKFGVGNSIFRIGSGQITEVDTLPFGIYRKEIFNETGLYNERLIRNHDIELSKRIISMHKKIYLVPSAKCIYYVRETFSGIGENNFRNGFWNILTVYITKKFTSISARHFIPLFFVSSLIFPLVLMIWFPPLGLIAAASFIVYLLIIFIVSLKIKDKTSSFYFIIRTFITLHLTYGFGSLTGLFRIDYLFKSK